MYAKYMCKKMADDDDTCDSIAAVACYFCLVKAEIREEIVFRKKLVWLMTFYNVAASWGIG